MKKEKFNEMSFLNLGKSMVRFLKIEGYEVKFCFNGGEPPTEFEGMMPDIVAAKGDEIIIVEVVTRGILTDENYLKEVKNLSRYVATRPDEKIKFSLITPKDEFEEIKKMVSRNYIYVNSFYHLNL